MAVTKIQARRVRQPVLVGDLELTDVLDGVALSTQIIELSSVAEKITIQSSGDLVGTYSVSVNGVDFDTPIAFSANTLISYTTHLVRVVKFDWVSGSGEVHLVAR